MKVLFDAHTHTSYSHGKDSIEDNVQRAVDLGFAGIVISEHAPKHYFARKLCYEKYAEMRREIDRLKAIYPGFQIDFALECNIISAKGEIDLDEKTLSLLDYFYVGFHYLVRMKTLRDFFKIQVRNYLRNKLGLAFLFPGLEAFNTNVAVQAVLRYAPKLFVHPTSYVNLDIVSLAKACAQTHTLLEVNSHRCKLSVEELRKVQDIAVDFLLGSDAHCKEDVGNLDNALRIANEAGIPKSRVKNLAE